MMELMDEKPYDFIINAGKNDLERLEGFVHRTFNSNDFVYFVKSLKNIYKTKGGLESIFNGHKTDDSLQQAIHMLQNVF